MSIGDVPEIRELFTAITMKPVSLTYWLAGGTGTPAKELIISGGAHPLSCPLSDAFRTSLDNAARRKGANPGRSRFLTVHILEYP